jgi:lipopolysaccharide export system protein LptA
MAININARAGALLCAALAAGSASALKNDKNQPINIQADHADFRDNSTANNGTGTYSGHVVMSRGSISLTANKATVSMVNNELQSAELTGNPATFDQQPDAGEPMHGVADQITYDAGKNQVDLIGHARVSQGVRLLSADVIHYNTETEHMTAKGASDDGRVHLTIPPKQSTATTPTAAPAPRTRAVPAAGTRQAPAQGGTPDPLA